MAVYYIVDAYMTITRTAAYYIDTGRRHFCNISLFYCAMVLCVVALCSEL